jgi:hypothetical protein
VAAYLDADSLGEDLVPPYAIGFDPARVGEDTFVLRARAWDAAGNRGESPPQTLFISLPDLEGPSVAITAPADSSEAVVPTLVWIEITATDATGVDTVRLFIDEVQLGDDDTLPYRFIWDTSLHADNAPHQLVARADDLAGNLGSSPPVTVFVYTVPLAAPSLLTPEPDAILTQESPLNLSWADDSFASRFQLQVAGDPDFAQLVVDMETTATSASPGLSGEGWFHWRVRGWRPGSG